MKPRRQPYATLPAYLEGNGFIADLIHQIREASLGLHVTYLKKNNDTYIAIRLPDPAELAAIEARTPEAAE